MSEPEQQPTEYELFRGEDRLGTVTVTDRDYPWTYGDFVPTEFFEKVKPLFEAELALASRPDLRSAWKDAYGAAEGPGLRLEPKDPDKTLTNLILHIVDNEVRWQTFVRG